MARLRRTGDLEPIELIRLYLEEHGIKMTRFSTQDRYQPGKTLKFLRIRMPFGHKINVHVDDVYIKIRLGSVLHGSDITIKGTLADPNNLAMKNVHAIIEYFAIDGWAMMTEHTNAQE